MLNASKVLAKLGKRDPEVLQEGISQTPGLMQVSETLAESAQKTEEEHKKAAAEAKKQPLETWRKSVQLHHRVDVVWKEKIREKKLSFSRFCEG